MNLYRGKGVAYREILEDVCRKMTVIMIAVNSLSDSSGLLTR